MQNFGKKDLFFSNFSLFFQKKSFFKDFRGVNAKNARFSRVFCARRAFLPPCENMSVVCAQLTTRKTRLVTVARGPVPRAVSTSAAARNGDVLSYPAWRGTGPRPNGSKSGDLALQAIRPGEGQPSPYGKVREVPVPPLMVGRK